MKVDIHSLHGGYGGRLVLDGIDFSVKDASIITLLGPNGSGKSTLLKIIGRIMKPKSGMVALDGKAIATYGTLELAKRMAILPQIHNVSGDLTVEELVCFGRFPHRKMSASALEHDRKVVDEALEMTRMTPFRKRQLQTLSGGERQRAWIAMTLTQEPELLLLDEPTTFLDICCQFEIIEMVKQLNRNRNTTVIMVLHDLNLAASCSDEMIMLKDQKICFIGSPKTVMTPEILREIFEIESKIILTDDGTPYCLASASAREN